MRGQAIIYDPRGNDITEEEFNNFDDAVMNIVLERYSEGDPVTNDDLDRLAEECQDYMEGHAAFHGDGSDDDDDNDDDDKDSDI